MVFGVGKRIEAAVMAELARTAATRQKADRLLDKAEGLMDDVQDGFRAIIGIEALNLIKAAMMGGKLDDAVTVDVDITWDRKSGDRAIFKGGDYDGQSFKIPAEAIDSGTIILKGGQKYAWNGYVWEFTGTE